MAGPQMNADYPRLGRRVANTRVLAAIHAKVTKRGKIFREGLRAAALIGIRQMP